MTQFPLQVVQYTRPRTIEERWQQYDADHPQVYAALVRLAYEAQASGQRKIGIRMLWERLRWTMHIEHRRHDFKMNDQYTSRYVRKIIEEHPALGEMFETRELRAV